MAQGRTYGRYQLGATLMLSAALIAATIVMRPRDVTGPNPHRLWADKAHWQAVADVVLAGDSRTTIGLSPEAVATHVEDARIVNFGFEASVFTPEYLKGIEEVLDPASPRKIIVLGTTPLSVTRAGRNQNSFVENRRRPVAGTLTRILDPVEWNLRRMDTSDLKAFFFGQLNSFSEYHSDGWVARWQVRDSPTKELAAYRKLFAGNTVDTTLQNGLCDQVRRWTQGGIRVYAFRPPTTADMVDLENQRSGFDEAAFVRQFQAAGGRWLIVRQVGYRTYDGSHLSRDGAIQFSGDLAELIRQDLAAAASPTLP
jgi:hypothetical protein